MTECEARCDGPLSDYIEGVHYVVCSECNSHLLLDWEWLNPDPDDPDYHPCGADWFGPVVNPHTLTSAPYLEPNR